MTECHFVIPGRDRGDVLATWAAGVSYARILNNHQRHGDVLKIATAADFCGTRWQNNAVIIPTPKGNNRAYLQPVARVMQLYRHHIGSHAIEVGDQPDGLDVVASRRGDTVFLHVANTQRTRAVTTTIQIDGQTSGSGRVFEITDDPTVEVSYLNGADVMKTVEKPLPDGVWEFPAASVSLRWSRKRTKWARARNRADTEFVHIPHRLEQECLRLSSPAWPVRSVSTSAHDGERLGPSLYNDPISQAAHQMHTQLSKSLPRPLRTSMNTTP